MDVPSVLFLHDLEAVFVVLVAIMNSCISSWKGVVILPRGCVVSFASMHSIAIECWQRCALSSRCCSVMRFFSTFDLLSTSEGRYAQPMARVPLFVFSVMDILLKFLLVQVSLVFMILVVVSLCTIIATFSWL